MSFQRIKEKKVDKNEHQKKVEDSIIIIIKKKETVKREKRRRELYMKRTKAKRIIGAFLAQSVERAAFNRKVVGSRPTGGVFL